ncbi:BapA/Bap/LapF family large adhesin [Acinetobacter soli]|uniref:BapA/Bap/LapF family large adhesin n=3 Tax=Acinetobacter TaxID=469 RepID=UPI00148B88B7|nr:BapA/Bap/LapF family large adhesin [Acinetobacter soli]
MPNIQIIAKESHAVLADITGNSAKLTEASVVLVKVSADDVQEVTRDGTSAIIKLKNGEVIVIDDFFSTEGPTDNSLVFQDDSNKLIWVQFTDAQGALLENVAYQPIDSIEPLLYGHSETSPWAWAAVPVTAGGILWWAHNRDSDNDNNNPPVVNPPATPTTPATVFDDKQPITGNVSNGSSTNDASPLISGTGTAGTTITVYDGNTLLGTTTVGSDGKWSFTPTTPLTDGTHSITYTVKDAAGNESGKSPAIDFTVDTIAPDTPTIAPNATDDVAPVIGPITAGSSTNDNTPTLTGTGTAGEIITVYDGATKLGTATVGMDGKWIFTPSPALADGSHSISYTATDKAGNESGKSPAIDFTVDTVAPDAPTTLPVATDDVAPIKGPIAAGSSTNDNTPTLSGTGTPGETITVYDGNTSLGTTTVGTDGNWSFPTPPLTDGPHSISYTATDKAGNESGKSPAIDFTVDTVAPDAPTSTPSAIDDQAPITGLITAGSSTNDNTPLLSGTGTVGQTITVYDGNTALGTATVGSDGKWVFTPSPALTDGPHSISYTTSDAAGNESGKSPSLDFTVDTIAPLSAVTIGSIVDDVAPMTGPVANGGFTNDTTPTLSGSLSVALAAGETLEILRDGVVVGTATVNGTTWSYTDNGLTDGNSYIYTARAVDAAGNRGAISSPYSINVDTSAPTQTVTITTVNDNVEPVTGPVANGGTTNDSTPELRGSVSAALAANEVIAVYRDGVKVGTATVNGTTWSYTDGGLSNGSSYSYTARVEDAAGNVGGTSDAYSINIQTAGSNTTVSIGAIVDDVEPVTGTVANGGFTNDTSPTLNGSISSGLVGTEQVIVYRDGVQVGTATVNGTSWSYTDSAVTEGSHTYTAAIVDDAGNSGTVSSGYTINVDTTAPVQTVTITQAIDNVDPVTGTIPANGVTNDDTPEIQGTLSSGLSGTEQVIVYRDGVAVGVATVNGTSWSYTDGSLASGSTYTYTAKVVDAAGNSSASSNELTFSINTSGVNQTTTILSVVDDQAPVTGNVANGGFTNDTTPTINGSINTALGNGDKVEVLRDGVVIGTATVTGTSWSYTDMGLVDGSSYSYTARVVNNAGTSGALSGSYIINVDTTAPLQTTTIEHYIDDQLPKDGTFDFSVPTNDTSPAIQGTVSGALGSGEVVAIYRDGVYLGNATVVGGIWSFQDSGLMNGSYSYTAQVQDAAGNAGASSQATLKIDTVPPAAPLGTFNASGSEISGTAEAGSVVKVKDLNGNVLGSATADSNGNYKVTLADPLNDAEKVKITATDKAGNESQATDLTAPNVIIDAVNNVVSTTIDFEYPTTTQTFNDVIKASWLLNVAGLPVISTGTTSGTFTVGPNTIADANFTVSSSAVLSLLDGVSLTLSKQNSDGTWTVIANNSSGGLLDLLGLLGQTATITIKDLTSGNYRLDFNTNALVGLGGSIDVDVSLTNRDTSTDPTVTAVKTITGNVITDNDASNGQDQVTSQTKVTAVNGQTVAADGTTTIVGEHGTLTVKADGSYSYTPKSDITGIGKTDVFTYTITDASSGKSDTAKLIVQIGTNSDLDLTWKPNDPEADATSVVATNNEDTVGVGATNTETTVTGPSINESWIVGLGGSKEVISQTITIAQGNLGAIEIGLSTGSLVGLGGAASIQFQKLVNTTWTTVNTISASSLADLIGLFPNGNGKVYDDLEAGQYRYILNYTRGISVGGSVSVSSEVTSTDLDSYTVTSRETVTGNVLTEDTGSGTDKVASAFTELSISTNGNSYTTVSSTGTTIQGVHGTLVIKSDGSYTYTPNTTLTGGGEDQFTYKLTAPNGDESTATLTFNAGFVYNTSAGADIITSSAGDDTFTTNAGADKVIFNLLNNTDATGGNGHDTWTDFSKTQGDKVDISALLTGQSVTASNIANYVTVTKDGADTVISIDRDGTGTTYQSTELLTLKNVNTTLDELLQNNHLIY